MSSHHQSDSDVRARPQVMPDDSPENSGHIDQMSCDLDVVKRDRFELLSAYLDGEVSPKERRLVSAWLTHDPDTQCLYRRLLYLRQGFNTLCQTPATESTETLTSQVYQRLNQGVQRTCMASFAAIALAVFGVFSGTISNRLWGGSVLQSANPLMGQSAVEIDTQNSETVVSPVTVASESRMETLVEQFNRQPNSINMGSEL